MGTWGPRQDDLQGRAGLGEGCCPGGWPWTARPTPGRPGALTVPALHPQGGGREAPGSLRQPHPADLVHVSRHTETQSNWRGWSFCWGGGGGVILPQDFVPFFL